MKARLTIAIGVIGLLVFPCRAGTQETPRESEARLAWWREARFGLFIHWGPVSLKGTEISWSRGAGIPVDEYDRLYLQFNPTNFNANAWAGLAREAGMRYVVLTTKHHDGFCLWNTRLTDYNIMNSPCHRDVVRELALACRKRGIVFAAYYSISDWHHRDYPLGSGGAPKPNPNMDRYCDYMKGQLAELIRNYGPLGILWFDGPYDKPWTPGRGLDLEKHVRSLQPAVIINDRVGSGYADAKGAWVFGGDYDTPEQKVGKFQNDRPWESCITMCRQWAWKPNDEMKSLKECLQTLISCAGGDGNLLFNVGPMPSGEIEPRQVERLKEMGDWLKQYGGSIYGTRGGPFKPGRWGASTHRGKGIYLHVFQWPDQGLSLPPIGARIMSSRVLTGGEAEVKQTALDLSIFVAAKRRQAIDTIIELELDRPANDVAPVSVAGSLD